MELKEYLAIIKKYRKPYLLLIVFLVALTWAYFYFQPVVYETSLTLNVTRSGTQETADYRYDAFYRLQADEKFSDTIVEWLKSPRIVEDIFFQAKVEFMKNSLKNISGIFEAERRTSQVVAVKFISKNPDEAKNISAGVIKVISEKTIELNENQKEPSWFQIKAEDPLTVKKITDWKKIFAASLVFGIFLGFFVVLGKYYLE